MIYFAYGSNMESTQMQSRCPGNTPLGTACLSHYTLIFSRWSRSWNSGTADIVPAKGCEVWGMLYNLTCDDLRRVDTFADYPNSYVRQDIPVQCQGEALPALTYIAVRQGVFAPSKSYRNQMILGATQNNLPESYLTFLRDIETHD